MGMPNIPDIKPNIKLERDDMINLLLASVALEELGLAHIINAEGEKIQCITDKKEKCDLEDLLEIDKAVNETLRNVIKKEMLLQFKLENIMKIMDEKGKKKPKKCED